MSPQADSVIVIALSCPLFSSSQSFLNGKMFKPKELHIRGPGEEKDDSSF